MRCACRMYEGRKQRQKRNIEARSCHQCCSGKAINIAYSQCAFVALAIQHAMRIRHVVICGLPGSSTFTTLSHKPHDFQRKNMYWFSCKVPVIYYGVLMKLEFARKIFEKYSTRLFGAEMSYADGQI